MKCHRCGSVMIREMFYGPHEHFLGWKCIFCGEIIDPVILQNRHESRSVSLIKQEIGEDNTQWL